MSKAGEVYNVPRGTAYLTTQQIITYTTYLIFYVALARILRPDEVGQVSLLLAAQAAFIALTQLGLPSAATRYISGNIGRGDQQTAGAVARTILRLSILVGAICFATAALISPFVGPSLIGSSDAGTFLILTFLSGFLLDIILVYGAYFIGIGAYARNLYQNALYIPLSRGLGLLLAILGYRVTGIVSGWVIGGLVAVLLSTYLWHGQLPEKNSHPIRPLLAFSLPVFGSALIAFGQQYGDITLLQAIIGQLSTTGASYLLVSSVSFLSVLWLGAALAAIAPTAIELVYGPTYTSQAGIFAILALATIFTAQGAILTTSLQAVGRARQVLIVTLVSTVVGLLVVVTTARFVGTLGGALGRTILSIGTVFLARRSMGPSVKTHSENALPIALLLAIGVGIPLAIADYLLIGHLSPFRRLPILLGVFALAFLAISRTFKIFRASDFAILKDAMPHRFHPQLRAIEHLIVGRRKDTGRG